MTVGGCTPTEWCSGRLGDVCTNQCVAFLRACSKSNFLQFSCHFWEGSQVAATAHPPAARAGIRMNFSTSRARKRGKTKDKNGRAKAVPAWKRELEAASDDDVPKVIRLPASYFDSDDEAEQKRAAAPVKIWTDELASEASASGGHGNRAPMRSSSFRIVHSCGSSLARAALTLCSHGCREPASVHGCRHRRAECGQTRDGVVCSQSTPYRGELPWYASVRLPSVCWHLRDPTPLARVCV